MVSVAGEISDPRAGEIVGRGNALGVVPEGEIEVLFMVLATNLFSFFRTTEKMNIEACKKRTHGVVAAVVADRLPNFSKDAIVLTSA